MRLCLCVFLFFVLVPCAAISVMDQSQTRGHWSSQWWKNRKQERQQKFNILQHLGQQWESITSITMLLLISILNKVILGHKVFWGEAKIYFLAKRGTARPLPLPEQTEAILPVDASFALSGYPLAQGKILFFPMLNIVNSKMKANLAREGFQKTSPKHKGRGEWQFLKRCSEAQWAQALSNLSD